MDGKLKILLLIPTVLAMGASAAPSANAAVITASEYPAVVTGSQEGANNYFETTPGRRIQCSTATGEATISESSKVVLVTPHLAGCQAGGIGLTFDLNGCTFEAIAGENTSATETHGSVNVTCPAGKKITVTAATCQIHVGPQTISGGLTITNLPGGQVTIDVDVTEKLHYEETDGFLCPFEGNTTGTKGSFVASLLLTGYNDQGVEEDPITSGTIDHKHSPTSQAIHVK